MHRVETAPIHARFPEGMSSAWLARRWYYASRSHRSYSVRQISAGDRRRLAEFALTLDTGQDRGALRDFSTILFERVLVSDSQAIGFAALETTGAGDRVIGVAAYAPTHGPKYGESADFTVAVLDSFRDEQVGRTLLMTLLRQARRVGVRRVQGETFWSNRPVQVLARSIGFSIEPLPRDRSRRLLTLNLK
jgi:GNAT superfamily N-acetyltransferase